MTTTRRADANAQNAEKSTGSRTGQSVRRLNALRHGPLAREILLAGEDEDVELGQFDFNGATRME